MVSPKAMKKTTAGPSSVAAADSVGMTGLWVGLRCGGEVFSGQVLRLTAPGLPQSIDRFGDPETPGAPFAQDDKPSIFEFLSVDTASSFLNATGAQ